MKSTLLLYPMLTHVLMVALLYALLTVARAPVVWNVGKTRDGQNPWKDIEPRISANIDNQFEWPLFFYIACVILLLNNSTVDSVQVWLAWVFIIGRLAHSYVHIAMNNIRLRGIVFTINFVAVLLMWVYLAFGS